MDNEYTQLPSAEAVAASAAGSSSLLLAAAASNFGSHDPYSDSSIAPYAPHEGSHSLQPHEGSHSSQSYEPVPSAAPTSTASSVYQAQQATRKRGRPPGSKNKPHVGPSVDTQSHGVPQPRRRYRACACRRPAHRARLRHGAACPGSHRAQYARGISLRRRAHTAYHVVHRRRAHRRRARDAVTTTTGTKASLRCRPTSRWYALPPSTRGRDTPRGVSARPAAPPAPPTPRRRRHHHHPDATTPPPPPPRHHHPATRPPPPHPAATPPPPAPPAPTPIAHP